jgi:hypothetical protein
LVKSKDVGLMQNIDVKLLYYIIIYYIILHYITLYYILYYGIVLYKLFDDCALLLMIYKLFNFISNDL